MPPIRNPPPLEDVSSLPYDGNVRSLRIVTVDSSANNNKNNGYIDSSSPSISALKIISKFSLVVSCILFVCLLVIAGCFCRPMVVTGGLWIALFFLCHGILGLKVTRAPTRPMVVGYAWLSAVVALFGFASTGYLFSGHLLIACISVFHYPDQSTVIRLYVVEVASLVASVPCMVGGLGCMVAAVVAIKATQVPKPEPRPPMIFYLKDWADEQSGSRLPNSEMSRPAASAPRVGRSCPNSPPPPYTNLSHRESFA